MTKKERLTIRGRYGTPESGSWLHCEYLLGAFSYGYAGDAPLSKHALLGLTRIVGKFYLSFPLPYFTHEEDISWKPISKRGAPITGSNPTYSLPSFT